MTNGTLPMELDKVLGLVTGLDKPKLEQLIYALVDIYGLTYKQVSTADILANMDRLPHLSALTNTVPTVGKLSQANLPIPDTGRAKILLDNYDRSYSAYRNKLARQQQARLGSFQIKRW